MSHAAPTGLAALTAQFRAALAAGPRQSLPLMPRPAQALLAWLGARDLGHTALVITEGPQVLDTCHQDLRALAGALPVTGDAVPPRMIFFPALETLPGEKSPDPELSGARMQALLDLHAAVTAGEPVLLVTCVQALQVPTPRPADLHALCPVITVGTEVDPQRLAETLVAAGYDAAPEVQAKGQFTPKGGLLDVWPVSSLWPVRFEFLGDTLESIRTFDPLTQRSVEKPNAVRLAPAREQGPALPAAGGPGLLAGLPPGAIVFWTNMDAIAVHADAFVQRVAEGTSKTRALTLDDLQARFSELAPPLVHWHFETAPAIPLAAFDFTPLPVDLAPTAEPLHPDAMQQQRQRRLAFVVSELDQGQSVHLFFDTAGTRKHFDVEAGKRLPGAHRHESALSEGFRSAACGLTVLAEGDVYGQRKQRVRPYDPIGTAPRPARDQGDRLADLAALRTGDLVVHLEHGLGRYLGLADIECDGQRQEVITIEYDEGAKLHVPVAHAHLLSRYVSVSRQRPKLHRLGGRRWEKEKADAEKAIADMAAALLETQAHRDALEGFAFPPDAPWQREFEASFPYEETPDQIRAIADVKRDLESTRPTDRLICGDAGYGKTEVAMRAAFKAVMAGRQVAVLVPTTVLAQQHYQTFCERMAPYPFRIEVLSRFSRGRHAAIIHGLAEGTVDIVIGTHALVQPAVRFHNLGLAIIDEEQRFGVAHKERLKHIRRLVDVLTLTATPIPRTLYMSMTGSRDMSLLQTPPRQRMAIETTVTRNTDDVVRAAIERELNRDGQVFYLHNRVMTIERARQRLQALVPHARIAVAHGQMSAGQLKDVMRRFVQGEADVLLCTTIIESGVDIPRANTILIDRADRFGIADLYQLRGRVGRSTHKAYAILLVPPHGPVDEDARKRIGAIQRHAALGAGFHLALQDLEIRGAGNLLGAQQSGHIAAIGFGLYCQLLQRTVARLKGKPLPPLIDVELQLDFLDLSPAAADTGRTACIPYAYIPSETQRMEMYRRVAQLAELPGVPALRAELEDRFGAPPPPVDLLLTLAEIRLHAYRQKIHSVRVREDKLVLARAGGELLMERSQFPRLRQANPARRLAEIIERIRTSDRWS
ncbi:MAG: transcription-repair coupling factor [Lentisphaerae bacterium]|nr:transcription-repair coupling factor [Lentisphaerota bacterium]